MSRQEREQIQMRARAVKAQRRAGAPDLADDGAPVRDDLIAQWREVVRENLPIFLADFHSLQLQHRRMRAYAKAPSLTQRQRMLAFSVAMTLFQALETLGLVALNTWIERGEQLTAVLD